MVLLNAIARGINFILGIILAKTFLPEDTDIYLFVWGLINFFLMFVSTINLMVAGPAYIYLYSNGREKEAGKLNIAFLNLYLVFFLTVSIITFFFPVAFFKVVSGFETNTLIKYLTVLKLSGIWLTAVIVNSFLGNILLSKKYFTISIFGQVIAAVSTLGIIFFTKERIGINSFLYGQLIGNVFCLGFYLYFLLIKVGQTFSLLHFKLPQKVIKELIASFLNSVPTLIINFLLIYFLSKLITGLLSAYNYGSNLSNLPDVILLSQIISVLGVKLSEISAKETRQDLFSFFSYYSRHLFFFMTILAILFSIFSTLIVEIIYGKKELDSVVFNGAVYALNTLVFALPFKALDVMHNRLFASLQILSTFVKLALPVKIINVGLLILLASIYGFKGIIIHQLILPLIMVIVELMLLKKFMMLNIFNQYIKHIILLSVIAGFIFLSAFALKEYLFSNFGLIWMILSTCISVGILVIFTESIFGITFYWKTVKFRIKKVQTFIKS